MIIITGATGQLGSLVVDRLLERVPAEQVGVSVRDPEDAGSLAARGVRVRRGDFTDPASLASAFEGADQVLVISAAIMGADAAAAAHRSAIDAARASGAGRVLYTSHQAAAADSRFDPARGHAATEQHLAASGGAYTVLRNGFYATTVPRLVEEGLRTGTILAPADGPVSWTTHDAAAAAHRAAIDAARASGAGRVLYTSHQAAAADSRFDPARGHAATEQYLAASGGAYTVLRSGFYATTVPRLVDEGLRTGTILAPAGGPVSWTTHTDLAEATAVVLADEGRLDGIAPPLTGSEALDLADVAALLTELTGRTTRRVVVEDDEWVSTQVARGVPGAAATFMLGMFLAARRGEFDVVDPTLPELLGRPTTPIRSFLKQVLDDRAVSSAAQG